MKSLRGWILFQILRGQWRKDIRKNSTTEAYAVWYWEA